MGHMLSEESGELGRRYPGEKHKAILKN